MEKFDVIIHCDRIEAATAGGAVELALRDIDVHNSWISVQVSEAEEVETA